ncbi:MAG: hypothetical protein LBH98_00765, partial [Chitinispirillales bacterium]|nr:hypothetical protein [Chitinispirillales bacterium]
QNAPTPIENTEAPAEGFEVCREVAENIFTRIMNWQPLDEAAEIAANKLEAKMRDANFFSDQYELTQKQKDFIRDIIARAIKDAAIEAAEGMKDYREKLDDYTGKTVIEEMIKIPEMTMRTIGKNVNRGALLAMTAVQAKATNEDRDEILMWKSKTTGDITIPTRGVFISTNCIEKIKQAINFHEIEIDTEVV